jgi:orotidine-5'-phosphate decarboxylase
MPADMPKLIVALDLPSCPAALGLVDELGDAVEWYKVGAPLFTRSGPVVVRELRARGRKVFLDLKYHDIPNTVGHAVAMAGALDVQLLTVHASGGSAMMRAARKAAGTAGPGILGVTILTSFRPADVEEVWDKSVRSVRDEVERLAGLAAAAGLDGVVASPLEIETIKRRHPGLVIVTPGIRPVRSDADDQARAATPAAAARAGADFLVVGRPILEAGDRIGALEAILDEIESGEQVTTP